MTEGAVIITGASDGIGAAAARGLASKGRRLLLVGRSRDKIEAVGRATGAQTFVADFAEFAQVRRLADELTTALDGAPVAVLANNAGGIFADMTPTVDGNNPTMQIGHFSPYLLTRLLMPQLLAGRAAVVNTSSIAHRLFGHLEIDDLDNRRSGRPDKAYGDAKLANILFTKSLHAKYADQGLTSVAFHPGVVRSNFAAAGNGPMKLLYHSFLKRFLMSARASGELLQWFIEGTPGQTWTSGDYWAKRHRGRWINPQINDAELAEQLWQRSAERVGLSD